jgi:hypothetical protein
MEVGSFCDVVEEELEQVLGLFLLEANYTLGEALIYVESFLLGDRMDANDGMLWWCEWYSTYKRMGFTSVSMASRRTGPPRFAECSA